MSCETKKGPFIACIAGRGCEESGRCPSAFLRKKLKVACSRILCVCISTCSVGTELCCICGAVWFSELPDGKQKLRGRAVLGGLTTGCSLWAAAPACMGGDNTPISAVPLLRDRGHGHCDPWRLIQQFVQPSTRSSTCVRWGLPDCEELAPSPSFSHTFAKQEKW